jgi:ferredoxin-NADP reductase
MNLPLPWLRATASELHEEAVHAKTITFDVPGWRGHVAGQHVDIRLTAEDGYVAQRSYSISSPAGYDQRLQLTVERVDGGEVSPFLLDELRVGDGIELRGPIGGYFTWSPLGAAPLMLIAGGSGIAPLMAMLRTRAQGSSRSRARLLYSSRSERHILFRRELDGMQEADSGFALTHTLTREARSGWAGERGRIGRAMLERRAFEPRERPDIFVCGPTPFVDAIADHLVALGHEELSVKTERFGPTGDRPRTSHGT